MARAHQSHRVHIWAVSRFAELLELSNKVTNILKYWCILYIETYSLELS